MSIFPRKLTRGENCIIHLKFENTGKKPKNIYYNLTILDPNGEKVEDITNNLLLGCDNNEFKKELYYCFKTNKDTILGKYRVIPTFFYDGMKYKSKTSNFDYFLVEEINVENVAKNEFLLYNISLYATNIKILEKNGDNIISHEVTLKSHERLKLKSEAKQKFIMYGNNYIEQLINNEDIIYMRDPKVFWKKQDENIIIYTEEDEIINLDNKYMKIWILLDGLRTNKEICELLNIKLKDLLILEKELINQKYIIQVNQRGE